jgi:hypothetical protein
MIQEAEDEVDGLHHALCTFCHFCRLDVAKLKTAESVALLSAEGACLNLIALSVVVSLSSLRMQQPR